MWILYNGGVAKQEQVVTFVRRVYGVDEAAANARWILPGKHTNTPIRFPSLYIRKAWMLPDNYAR